MDKKYKLAILRNETEDDHKRWISACKEFEDTIDYTIIDLTKNDWLERVTELKYDYYLAKPPGLTARFKQLYDERIYLIENNLRLPVYPALNEILIYENKRFFYSWLKVNKLPHPETYIFYDKFEASDFINDTAYPLVAKYNIGASGSGVRILKNKSEADEYLRKTFSNSGASRRRFPKIFTSNFLKRFRHYINNPEEIKTKRFKYSAIRSEHQSGFVLFQEFIPHTFEWRVVVIGDSYFAHKKLKVGEKASGSLLKNYDTPPLYIFDFVKNIVHKFSLTSQAFDLFENSEGNLLINEMQCIFGQSDPYQMMVDGKPGRYRFIEGKWIFEEGNFNKNESYNLRIENILELLKRKTN